MSAPATSPRRLHVVGVCHQLQPDAFAAKLQKLASRHGVTLRGVVVCNNTQHAWRPLQREVEVLRGSNRLLDYSGYFEGLDHLLARHPEAVDDNVLFVNDTLVTKQAAACILGRVLGLGSLLLQLQVPAMSGKLHPYRSICLRNPWSGLPGYITTFCFMLNARAVPSLRELTAQAAADDVFAQAELADDAWGRRMPPLFREHIRAHLSYAGSPYLWPSATERNADMLRRKASCVYFEGRLSGAIASAGALVPINAGPRSQAELYLHEVATRVLRPLFGRWR